LELLFGCGCDVLREIQQSGKITPIDRLICQCIGEKLLVAG